MMVPPGYWFDLPLLLRRTGQSAIDSGNRHLLLATVAALSCRQETPNTWGFVAKLGSDTTAVERITREGDRIAGETVGRSTVVVRRRWEATLGPDGAVRR